MKTFEEFEDIDESEKIFLQLAHIDELEIKFNFISSRTVLLYLYKDNFLFEITKKSKKIWINYEDVWYPFEQKYNTIRSDRYVQPRVLLDKYVKKYLFIKNDNFESDWCHKQSFIYMR